MDFAICFLRSEKNAARCILKNNEMVNSSLNQSAIASLEILDDFCDLYSLRFNSWRLYLA